MHYNVSLDPGYEADLHTFMANPEIFDVKEGHVVALQGLLNFPPSVGARY